MEALTDRPKPKMTTAPARRAQVTSRGQPAEVRTVLRRSAIQTKLSVGRSDNAYEREADQVAEHVLRMPEPQKSFSADDSTTTCDLTISGIEANQHACAPCLNESNLVVDKYSSENIANSRPRHWSQEERLVPPKPITPLFQGQQSLGARADRTLIQAKIDGDEDLESSPAMGSSIQSLQKGGFPLSRSERDFFEPRFGADFSLVRVHNDPQAVNLAQSVNARAFTLGRNIVFGAREYSSETVTGRKLLAHELTHFVQQNSGPNFLSEGRPSVIQRQENEENIPGGNRPPPTMNRRQRSEARPENTEQETGPTISAVPMERWPDITVVDFPPIRNLVPRYSLPDSLRWTVESGRINIVRIPTEFGIFLDAGADLRAGARLSGGVGPVELRNIQAGFSRQQAAMLRSAPPPLLIPIPPFVLPRSQPFRDFHPARPHPRGDDLGEFYVEAELFIPADLTFAVWAEGELEAAASVVGVIDLATLGGGIRADAHAGGSTRVRAQGQYLYRNGRLDVDHRLSGELDFELGYALTAFLEASLLGFSTRYDWTLSEGNFTRSWQTHPGINVTTNSHGDRRVRRIDLQGIESDLQQINEVIDAILDDNDTDFDEDEPEATGEGAELCLPSYATLQGRGPRRRSEDEPDEGNPYSMDGGSIDNTLRYITRSHRIEDAGLAFDDFRRKNVAVGKVWIGGRPMFIPKTNVPGGSQHSEDLIADEMQSLRSRGRPILTQLFSERRPCGQCMRRLNRDYNTDGSIETRHAQIFYAVSYPDRDLNTTRANELRSRYCLEREARRPPTEPQGEGRGVRPRSWRGRRGSSR